jgi:superfamily I DNA and/or RNA helicase
MDLVVKRFVEKQKDLLELERQAQLECQAEYLTKLTKQQLQQRGVALLNLREASRRTGLAGKLLVEYVGGFENELPAHHQIKVGDVVKIERAGEKAKASEEKEDAVSGIVAKVTATAITVSFKEDIPGDLREGVRMIKLANEVAFKRMRKALDDLEEVARKGLKQELMKIIFSGKSEIGIASLDLNHFPAKPFYNEGLNDSQQAAVANCLRSDRLALIHGPPGTGKTETLVEVIKQLAKPLQTHETRHKPRKILVCGPSNLSVDNLVERLGRDRRFSIVRLGHPARILESVLHHSLDYRVVHGDGGELARDIRREIDGLLGSLEKARGGAKREIYDQLKQLRKELRERERKSLDEIFAQTQIVLCTLNMAGSKQLAGMAFDVAVIDEGSQALEAECWIPALLAERLILAGDHQQLPPTVTSPKAAAKGLSKTLFTRLVEERPELVSMLRVQYRMHEAIMRWASDAMYEGKLIADSSVKGHLLSGIVPGLSNEETLNGPMVMIDTAGMDMTESVTEEAEVESKYNEGEAKLALNHAMSLIDAGLDPSLLAIITPYNGQVDLLEKMAGGESPLLRNLEIGTGTQTVRIA